jgi:uncharacterized protein with FMN-binding domain
VRARRVVAAVFAIALAVGAPTSITAHLKHSSTAVQASDHQPILVVADGGYPGTFEPQI